MTWTIKLDYYYIHAYSIDLIYRDCKFNIQYFQINYEKTICN